MKTVDQYIKERSEYSWSKHDPEEYGIWEIYAEDTNPDLGGSHHEAFLECVEGTYRKAVEYAFTLKDFFCWGWGGSIKKAAKKEIKKL